MGSTNSMRHVWSWCLPTVVLVIYVGATCVSGSSAGLIRLPAAGSSTASGLTHGGAEKRDSLLNALLVGVRSALSPFTDRPSDKDPDPPVWPDQFHAVLVQNRSQELALVDLWYDWQGGRNFNIIRKQLGSTIYDLEWTNHTSFYWDEGAQSCKTVDMKVGILARDWLKGAEYLGRRLVDTFDCHVWTKAEGFITYYADVKTGRPVLWEFGNEGKPFTMHTLSYEEGVSLPEEAWQAPTYCF